MYKAFLCVIGTLGFCSSLNAPKKKIIWILIGAFISGISFELSIKFGFDTFLSTTIASTILGIYCEIVARLIKTPTTVILLPATIPLLPGSALYYTIDAFFIGDFTSFKSNALDTIMIGLGIGIGTIITSLITKITFNRH